MSFVDNIRRRFASIGSEPAVKEDDPRSFGEGIIRRIKLQNQQFSSVGKKYEEHIGSPRV